MKIQIFLIMLCFAASDSFSQEDNNKPAFTTVHHNQGNLSVRNFDGTRSMIVLNGNSAALDNSDGTQTSIDFFGSTIILVARDGTQSTVLRNGLSSTVTNSDGTRFVVIHKQNSSSCSSAIGSHSINHFFAKAKERRFKNVIDILIHANWFVQKKQLLFTKIEVENK